MSDFLEVALAAAHDAEQIIYKYFDPKGIDSEKKFDGSPVTIADREAEAAIIHRIKTTFPDHSIFGEETGKEDNQSEYYWIIDPIDGTKNFTRGIPHFGTLIALMKNGEVIVGVSNMPLIDELMYAEKGAGAFLNKQRVHVSSIKALKDVYLNSGGLQYFSTLDLSNKIMNIREHIFQHRMLGDSYMYHLLAQGKIDAVVEASIKIYDVAPLKLIVEEAGGRATEIDGSGIGMDTTNFLATNSNVHNELVTYFSKS